MNKYHARKTKIGKEDFDSQLEARFYQSYLLPWSIADKFKIERQKEYRLEVNGKMISRYIADFVVTLSDGTQRVYECKGMFLPDAKIKMRLFAALFSFEVWIVRSLSSIERMPEYGKRRVKG